MIDRILNLLKVDEWHGKTDFIEIAKGKHKLEKGFKAQYKQAKREWKRK